ncbi:MAG: hypothetical protein K8E24_003110 [Methanobacterium paludis]|nr:hypothetical protein [Methanobacterium paludis]
MELYQIVKLESGKFGMEQDKNKNIICFKSEEKAKEYAEKQNYTQYRIVKTKDSKKFPIKILG